MIKQALTAATLAALAFVPVAHADTASCSAYNPCSAPGSPTRNYSGHELDYLADLDAEHVAYKDAHAAVDMGHAVCSMEVSSGQSDPAVNVVVARWPLRCS
jgi:hypothetical protein